MKQFPILAFSGEHRFLSNFWPSPVRLLVPGEQHEPVIFPSVEHAYQAAKKPHQMRHALLLMSAGEAKRAGRKGILPAGWDATKVEIMRGLLKEKFAPQTELSRMLLSTGEADIIEGNQWGDTFWGVCRGVGLNTMGRLLMARRAELAGGN